MGGVVRQDRSTVRPWGSGRRDWGEHEGEDGVGVVLVTTENTPPARVEETTAGPVLARMGRRRVPGRPPPRQTVVTQTRGSRGPPLSDPSLPQPPPPTSSSRRLGPRTPTPAPRRRVGWRGPLSTASEVLIGVETTDEARAGKRPRHVRGRPLLVRGGPEADGKSGEAVLTTPEAPRHRPVPRPDLRSRPGLH